MQSGIVVVGVVIGVKGFLRDMHTHFKVIEAKIGGTGKNWWKHDRMAAERRSTTTESRSVDCLRDWWGLRRAEQRDQDGLDLQ